jgi:hypothetical protein
MALPSSGTLTMNAIRIELGISTQSPFSLDTAENGGYVTINVCSPSRPSSGNPAAMSEWYSYNHTATCTPTPTPTPPPPTPTPTPPPPTATPTPTPTVGCQQINLYPFNSNPCDHFGSLTLFDTDNALAPTRLWVLGDCGITPVTGGNQWFSQGSGADSYQVDNGGFIISTTSC